MGDEELHLDGGAAGLRGKSAQAGGRGQGIPRATPWKGQDTPHGIGDINTAVSPVNRKRNQHREWRSNAFAEVSAALL